MKRKVMIGKSTCVERCKYYNPQYGGNPDHENWPYCEKQGLLSYVWGGDCDDFKDKEGENVEEQ